MVDLKNAHMKKDSCVSFLKTLTNFDKLFYCYGMRMHWAVITNNTNMDTWVILAGNDNFCGMRSCWMSRNKASTVFNVCLCIYASISSVTYFVCRKGVELEDAQRTARNAILTLWVNIATIC